MKVSVIIPTYNEESVIAECLDSLSKQTYKDLEIIVIDDGSTDKTYKILSEFRISNFEFRILREAHMGPGAARNLGVRHAKGEILVFVDADMTFEPNFIEKLIEPILQKKTKGTFSKEEYVSNKDNIWSQCWGIDQGWEEGKRHPKNYPATQKVFRAIIKDEFERAGGFAMNVGYTDDWTLSERLGYEATMVPGAKFYHKNPEALKEIFTQAKWSAKRRYKLGRIGILLALARSSLPISIVVSLIKSLLFKKPAFLAFKLVYDFGVFIGILELLLIRKIYK